MDTCNQLYGQMRILADFDIHAALPILLGIFLLFVCIDLLPPSPLLLLVNPALPLFDYYGTYHIPGASSTPPPQHQYRNKIKIKKEEPLLLLLLLLQLLLRPLQLLIREGVHRVASPTWPCLFQIDASIVRIDSSRHYQHPRLPSTHYHRTTPPLVLGIRACSCLCTSSRLLRTPYTHSSSYYLVGTV